jgi:hypothetical protein
MATSEMEKAAAQQLKAKNTELLAMVRESTEQTAAVIRDREKLTKEQNKRLDLLNEARRELGTGKQVFVDLTGGTLALVSTELVNWGIRAIGDYSKVGFAARNNDLLQSLPHIAVGTLTYIAEMCTRPDPEEELPGRWRLAFSEAAKLFAYSGFGNLARAVRMRISNGKGVTEDNAALRAEIAALKAAAAGSAAGKANT